MKKAIIFLISGSILVPICGNSIIKAMNLTGWSILAIPGFVIGIMCWVGFGMEQLRKKITNLENIVNNIKSSEKQSNNSENHHK
jgi:hypothetical protein